MTGGWAEARPGPAGGAARAPGSSVAWSLALAVAGVAVLPWYAIYYGFWDASWVLEGYPLDEEGAPAALQVARHGKHWLAPLVAFALAPAALLASRWRDSPHANLLVGGGALAYLCAQGFAIGLNGPEFGFLEPLGERESVRQFGLGYGGLAFSLAMLLLVARGLALGGLAKGDLFVSAGICLLVATIGTFILFPILNMLQWAMLDNDGALVPSLFLQKFADDKIWGLGCLGGELSCGAAWNSLFLAVLVGLMTTALGLAFALVVTRTGFRHGRLLRALTVLPIITPPFVIGLALILLFGLSGTVTQLYADIFDTQPTRWIYGLPGVLIAQLLAFTPIAFLVLIGVVDGVNPSVEEAAQTLRAGRWSTMRLVSLPLMRPGLANSFLLGFIESMADFGNPLILGGNYDVLSTEIFFAIVGAQNDQARAAVLAIILLSFTMAAFFAQRFWLGKKDYTTMSGKGDGGIHVRLPAGMLLPACLVTAAWTAFTVAVYAMIIGGGFVNSWGLDNSFTLRHFATNFSVGWTEHGIHWSGSAWNSFWTTIKISAIAAPLTAGMGLLAAWLLVRQDFAGKRGFEFFTLLSFAVPGTVIGVSYILAFNVPPIELTGTGIILVVSFVFRNMPVGVRAGIASMKQIDKSLDEAALTLGANSLRTARHVILPLLRPAVLAALVYSVVRTMTAISAVIFLVSAEYDMATSYIIGRVENNDYGLAISYSTTLIFVMLCAILGLQLLVGENRIGRRRAASPTALR